MVVTRPTRGFTLLEMIVVLAIIGIITSIALTGQSGFSRTVILSDTAYSVALSIREAQALGVSSQKFSTYNNAGYGVDFTGSNPTSYRIYSDVLATAAAPTWCPIATFNASVPLSFNKPGNCLYDAASEIVQTYNFDRGFVISSVCGYDTNNVKWCAPASGGIDVEFLRPRTEPVITGFAGNPQPATTRLTSAIIHVQEPSNGNERCVVVTQLGQVTLPTTCP